MDRSRPEPFAVAVRGERIIAVGSVGEVEAFLAGEDFGRDDTFKDKVVLPGFIDQHLHPILGALTLSTEVIATEDWVLPGRTFAAANGAEEFPIPPELRRGPHPSPRPPQGQLARWHAEHDHGADSCGTARGILTALSDTLSAGSHECGCPWRR